jgi:hypothetical protein
VKKPFCLLLAVLLVCALIRLPVTSAKAAGKVTILVYICGSDLESKEGEASGDIREMASSGIGASGAATVLLATGGTSRWSGYNFSSRSVQYYRLEQNGPALLQDAGQMNMGDAKTLSSFISYGISAAPAKRYIMIL